jgi:molecular chaperone GrpE
MIMADADSSVAEGANRPPSPDEDAAALGAAAPEIEGSGANEDGDLADAEAVLTDDIAAVVAERDDYLDALRRLQADFENYKKRTLKQQTQHLQRAAQGLVVQLLPVLDAVDLALAHGGGEEVATFGQLLLDTLVKEGLEGIAPAPGDSFDPNEHEAVVHEPGEGQPVVAELLRAGYRWKGHLLRAAMVKVRG